jgi:hypothetical protein
MISAPLPHPNFSHDSSILKYSGPASPSLKRIMRARTQARTCAIISLTTFRMQYLKRAFHNCHIAHSYQLERAAFAALSPF